MGERLCTSCGFVGQPSRFIPGDTFTAVVLWLMCGLPGLLYMLWQHMKAYDGCPACRSAAAMIPVESLVAVEFLERHPAVRRRVSTQRPPPPPPTTRTAANPVAARLLVGAIIGACVATAVYLTWLDLRRG